MNGFFNQTHEPLRWAESEPNSEREQQILHHHLCNIMSHRRLHVNILGIDKEHFQNVAPQSPDNGGEQHEHNHEHQNVVAGNERLERQQLADKQARRRHRSNADKRQQQKHGAGAVVAEIVANAVYVLRFEVFINEVSSSDLTLNCKIKYPPPLFFLIVKKQIKKIIIPNTTIIATINNI